MAGQAMLGTTLRAVSKTSGSGSALPRADYGYLLNPALPVKS